MNIEKTLQVYIICNFSFILTVLYRVQNAKNLIDFYIHKLKINYLSCTKSLKRLTTF